MDDIAEFVGRVVGAILRELFEAIFGAIFGRIRRFVGSIYNGIYQTVCWNLRSDFLATPVTILLMFALGAGLFFGLVKAVQWMIA